MNEIANEIFTDIHPHLIVGYFKERKILDKKIGDAYAAWYTSFGRQEGIEKANTIACSVIEVTEIELIEQGDYGNDYRNRCTQYAFGTCKGEEWALPHDDDWIHKDLWIDPLNFLQKKGYKVVSEPQAGDIVAYTSTSEDGLMKGRGNFEHFGILQEDGKVISKFAQGPVVKHPLELVPISFGKNLYFLRKIDPSVQ